MAAGLRPAAVGPGAEVCAVAQPTVAEVPAPAASRPRPPVIAMRNVTKTYGVGDVEVHALRETSLTIERGDYVAIMGASGSGKSTLMNILGCLDVPTSGRYRLAGVDVSELDDDDVADIRNRRIGFVFQSFNLIARTTRAGQRGAAAGLRRDEAIRATGARQSRRSPGSVWIDRLDHFPNQLSGGQQQRVAIARAIVTNPAMILADEPTGALDSTSTAEVLAIFDELNVEGRTVVVITHEDEVARHAKRVIRLRDGLIVGDKRNAPVDGLATACPSARGDAS